MILLQSLLNEGEVIADYIVAGSYCVWNCITTPGNTDIAGALEDTLHRGIDAGGYQSGKIPPDNEYPGLWQK